MQLHEYKYIELNVDIRMALGDAILTILAKSVCRVISTSDMTYYVAQTKYGHGVVALMNEARLMPDYEAASYRGWDAR